MSDVVIIDTVPSPARDSRSTCGGGVLGTGSPAER
jgi:hypothetical protein